MYKGVKSNEKWLSSAYKGQRLWLNNILVLFGISLYLLPSNSFKKIQLC